MTNFDKGHSVPSDGIWRIWHTRSGMLVKIKISNHGMIVRVWSDPRLGYTAQAIDSVIATELMGKGVCPLFNLSVVKAEPCIDSDVTNLLSPKEEDQ